MNRRSTPSAKRDDDAFPIRVKLAVPPEGLGRRLDEMTAWLRDSLPRDAYPDAIGRGNAHAFIKRASSYTYLAAA